MARQQTADVRLGVEPFGIVARGEVWGLCFVRAMLFTSLDCVVAEEDRWSMNSAHNFLVGLEAANGPTGQCFRTARVLITWIECEIAWKLL